MKKTFNIPDGCKTVSVEQVGNQIITSFEPEKYVPKVGDCVKRTSECGSVVFGVIKSTNCELGECITSEGECYNKWFPYSSGSFEKITPEEFQAEFEKHGYVYDFEMHTAKKKRWRAERDSIYYFVSGAFEIEKSKEFGLTLDDKRYKNGNYFKNEGDAIVYRNYMLQHSLKYFDK